MKNFVLLLMILAVSIDLSSQTRWYPSDSLGSWAPTGPVATDSGKGWWLGVSSEAQMQKELLFHDGVETQQRWLEFDSAGRPTTKRTFVDGVISSEIQYQTGTGAVQSETVYRQGEAIWVVENTWGSSGLLSRHVKDAAGNWLWDDRLFRYPNGRLRRLERTGPEGLLAQISWSSSENGSPLVWIVDEDLLTSGRHKIVTAENGGTREELWAQAELLVSTLTTQIADGASLQRETLPPSGTVTDRISDSRGRLISETVTLKDQNPQITRWTWDDKDRVIHDETSIRGGWETSDYTFPEPGTVVIEKRRLDLLTSRETRKDDEKALVELFDNGQKFLEEVWSGGKKTLERYIQDGLVVRERVR